MTHTICPTCAAALSEFIRNGTRLEIETEKTKTLGESILELLRAKEQAGRRKRYLTGLRIYLNQFSRGRENMPLHCVDSDVLEAWFLIRNEKPTSKRSSIGRLSSLFSFAVRRGWIKSNPCSRLERPSIDHNPPKILTIEECKKILNWADKEKPVFLAWLALALFVGVRPEAEADKLTWESIDLESGRLMISGAGTKVRAYRVVDLSQTPAMPWLQYAKERGAKLGLSTKARSRYTVMLREHLGWWVNDVLRHTAASYLCAHHVDYGKVAAMLGTSEAMLHRHYRSLVTPEEAARFMALRPI